MMDKEYKFSDSEVSNVEADNVSDALSYESNLTSIERAPKKLSGISSKKQPRAKSVSKPKQVKSKKKVKDEEKSNESDVYIENKATMTSNNVDETVKPKKNNVKGVSKKKSEKNISKTSVENGCSIEENADSIYLGKNKKKSQVKYENESFIDLCLNIFAKSNTDSALLNILKDCTMRAEVSKMIREVNSYIQNCSEKMIKCVNCKTMKNYDDFKELSTSVTGRQRSCLVCTSKCSKKEIVNVSEIEDI